MLYSFVIKRHSMILHANKGNNLKALFSLLLTKKNLGILFLCFQRIITQLDQNLRPLIENVIKTGKHLYTSDNKDSGGVESTGM